MTEDQRRELSRQLIDLDAKHGEKALVLLKQSTEAIAEGNHAMLAGLLAEAVAADFEYRKERMAIRVPGSDDGAVIHGPRWCHHDPSMAGALAAPSPQGLPPRRPRRSEEEPEGRAAVMATGVVALCSSKMTLTIVDGPGVTRLRTIPLTWATNPPEWVVMLHDDGRTPVVFSPIFEGSVVFPESEPVCCLPGDACPEGWSVVGVPHV